MAKFKKSNRKRFKTYSPSEKFSYHEDRVKSEKATENQRTRSRHWLNGFKDNYWKNNLGATQSELNRRKNDKRAADYNNNVLRPCINGMKARAEYEKNCTAEERMKLYNSFYNS